MPLTIYSTPSPATPSYVESRTESYSSAYDRLGVSTSNDYLKSNISWSRDLTTYNKSWAGGFAENESVTKETSFASEDRVVKFVAGTSTTKAYTAKSENYNTTERDWRRNESTNHTSYSFSSSFSQTDDTGGRTTISRSDETKTSQLVSYGLNLDSTRQVYMNNNTYEESISASFGSALAGRTYRQSKETFYLVDLDGSTTQTFETLYHRMTNDSGPESLTDTNYQGETISPRTGTAFILKRYFLTNGYDSATQSFEERTEVNGSIASVTSSLYVLQTQTLIGAWGATTANYNVMTSSINTSVAGPGVTTATASQQATITEWATSGTRQTTTQRIITTSSAVLSASTKTRKGVYLVSQIPQVVTDWKSTQKNSVYALTHLGEYLYDISVGRAFFDQVNTFSSKEYLEIITSESIVVAATSEYNFSESWPTENFTYIDTSNYSPTIVTTYNQNSSILPPITISVQGGATKTTTGTTNTSPDVFSRNKATQNSVVGGVFLTTKTLSGVRVGERYTESRNVSTFGLSPGVVPAVGWVSGAGPIDQRFDIIYYDKRSEDAVTAHTVYTRGTVAKVSITGVEDTIQQVTSSSVSAGGMTSTRVYANGVIVDGPILLGANLNVEFLRPAGPFAQSPLSAGWTETYGLGFGGMESWFPRSWVAGSRLATPVISQSTSSKVSGLSASIYQYIASLNAVTGKSYLTSNVSNTSTFSVSFSTPSSASKLMGSQSATNVSSYIGNKEGWDSSARGVISINGAAVATLENGNATYTQNISDQTKIIDNYQTGFENGWLAESRTFRITTAIKSPPVSHGVLTVSMLS